MTVQHFGVMLWSFGVCGRGTAVVRPTIGMKYAFAYLWYANKRELLRDDARWRVALQRSAIGKRLLQASS
jgi:hypothetical protein